MNRSNTAAHSRLKPPHAIRWFNLTHALGLALFIGAMGGFFWYLQHIEARHLQQGLYRDIEWAQQSLRLKWREDQDRLTAVAGQWAQYLDRPDDNPPNFRDFFERHPDVTYIAVLDELRYVRWVLPSRRIGQVQGRIAGGQVDDSAGFAAFSAAQSEQRAVFSAPFMSDDNEMVIEIHAPVYRQGRFSGTVIAASSLARTLNSSLTREVREHYQVMIVDSGGNRLVSTTPRHIHDNNVSYELPLEPPGFGVRLRAFAFTTPDNLIDRTLLAAVVGLGSASVFGLGLLWRHGRRRLLAEIERDRLFTLSVDPMAILQSDGKLDRSNPAFDELFGNRRASVALGDLTHPDDRARVTAAIAQLNSEPAQAPSTQFEARFLAGDQTRWLRWSVRGDGERPMRTLYAVAHDTTERKLAETALNAETSFRRAMEDSMATGMRVLDLNGRITYVNRAFCQILGFDESELLLRDPPFPYWPDDQYAEHRANLDLILSGKAPAGGIHVKVRRRDHTLIDARLYVSALIDEHGQQTGWMTSMTDITEPTRAREELAAAHERFTTVLDELDAAVSVAPGELMAGTTITGADVAPGQEPSLLFANRAYRGLFGADAAGHRALLDQPDQANQDVQSAVRAHALASSASVNGLDTGTLQERFVASVQRWFEVRSRTIRWVDGSIVTMVLASDITRRREAEELQRIQAAKYEGNARLITMGEMASSLAHELNQPLTAIANYCMGLAARVKSRQAAGHAPDADELLLALGKTAAQAERAGHIIRRIRNFVKRSEPDQRNCDLSAVVADAIGLAEIESSRQGVRLRVNVQSNLPTVRADPVLLEQVLLNLLKNAVEAMRDSPRRELEVSVVHRGRQIEVAVSDTGTGIDAQTRDKLFEPFYTTKRDGMGMGLNICRSIIEAHQGRLWVQDNTSAGCTFCFTLPVDVSEEVNETSEVQRAA